MRNDHSGVCFELEAGMRAGGQNVCDERRFRWLQYGDYGHALGSQLLNGKNACGGAWIDKPGDRAEFPTPRQLQCPMLRVAFENGETPLMQRTHESQRVDIRGRNEQTTRE